MNRSTQHKRTLTWVIGVLSSLGLLLVFMNLQAMGSNILVLDVKWLIVASIPLLIVILQSNIIQKFKGLGIEIETRLQQPITTIDLTTKDVLVELLSDEKGRVERLHRLPTSEHEKIQRLVFRINRADTYQVGAVIQYLTMLKYVRYFEVVNQEGRFIAMLPARIFRHGKGVDVDAIETFLAALRNNTLIEYFRGRIITDTLTENEDLLTSLRKVRESGQAYLPVIAKDGKLKGIARQRDIESKIADEVLAAKKAD